MVRKTKHDIEIKVVFDTREKDIGYTKLLLDKRIGSDGVKFVEIESTKDNNWPNSPSGSNYSRIHFSK